MKKALVIVLLFTAISVLVFGTVWLRFGTEEPPKGLPTTASEYVNTRYGYTVEVPAGWRLAPTLMQLLNSSGNPTKSATEAEIVVITDLDPEEELVLTSNIEKQRIAHLGSFLADHAYLIHAEDLDFGADFVEKLRTAAASGTKPPIVVRNIQKLSLGGEVAALRYTWIDPEEPDHPSEVVFIPHRGEERTVGTNGNPLKGILFEVFPGQAFSNKQFTRLYRSFRYVEGNVIN